MKFIHIVCIPLALAFLHGCGGSEGEKTVMTKPIAEDITIGDAELAGNPFMQEWDTPYGVPPFGEIGNAHFMPAIKKGILEFRADIVAIEENPEAPTFENTIVALETLLNE